MTWHERAECRNHDAHLWQTPNKNKVTKANVEAITICKGGCEVRTACLSEALDVEQGSANRWHIYGGLTPAERARLDNSPQRPKRKDRVG